MNKPFQCVVGAITEVRVGQEENFTKFGGAAWGILKDKEDEVRGCAPGTRFSIVKGRYLAKLECTL